MCRICDISKYRCDCDNTMMEHSPSAETAASASTSGRSPTAETAAAAPTSGRPATAAAATSATSW